VKVERLVQNRFGQVVAWFYRTSDQTRSDDQIDVLVSNFSGTAYTIVKRNKIAVAYTFEDVDGAVLVIPVA